MSNATELLRRAEECLRHAEYPNDYREEESYELRDDIIAYLATEKEAEPVAFLCDATRFKVTGSKAEGMICGLPQNLIGKWVAFVDADNGQHLRYTRPEKEAEPVGYAVKMIPRGLHFIGFVGEEETDEEIEEYGRDQIVPLYTRPDPELNLSCKSVQKRLVKQWGYEWEKKRKPMTDVDIDKGIDTGACSDEEVYFFAVGVRFAEKHHGIGGGDERKQNKTRR